MKMDYINGFEISSSMSTSLGHKRILTLSTRPFTAFRSPFLTLHTMPDILTKTITQLKLQKIASKQMDMIELVTSMNNLVHGYEYFQFHKNK